MLLKHQPTLPNCEPLTVTCPSTAHMQGVTFLKAAVLLCCMSLPELHQTLQHRTEGQSILSAASHKENEQVFLVSDSERKLTGTAFYRIGRCSPANLPRHVIWGHKDRATGPVPGAGDAWRFCSKPTSF